MALIDDVTALRDRVLRELTAAHDYYVDSKFAWRIVRKIVRGGRRFSIRNKATGTQTTQSELVSKAQRYLTEQLSEATFQQFISIFENYVFELLRLWLTAYPQSLIGKTVDFKAVLDAPDKDAIISLAVDKELNEVLYKPPYGWFEYLERRAKLGCPTPDEIERIAEAKASRDVLVHNRGVASKVYELKAGKFARYKDGQRIDISEQYHRDTWELLRKVVADVSHAAMAKFP